MTPWTAGHQAPLSTGFSRQEYRSWLLFPSPFANGFPGGSEVKAYVSNAGDPAAIPEVGRCPGEGDGYPLQYSCLENPRDRGAWWAAIYGFSQSRTRLKQLSMHACTGEGNGIPLQCSCLENPRDRGAWWAAIYGVAQSQTQLKRLSSSSSSKLYVNGISLNVFCHFFKFVLD